MSVYRIEVAVAATAYVRAKSKSEALAQALALGGKAITVQTTDDSEVEVSGQLFSDPELPTVSLSPAMTILGVSGTPDAERV